MSKKLLAWKAELGTAPDSAFSARLGNITYHVASRDYGCPAYVEVHESHGSLKQLDLGYYLKIEQAKQACERHYAAGCDLSKAKKTIR
jgi:hypothetical protein